MVQDLKNGNNADLKSSDQRVFLSVAILGLVYGEAE
jgi:hypothetical protein